MVIGDWADCRLISERFQKESTIIGKENVLHHAEVVEAITPKRTDHSVGTVSGVNETDDTAAQQESDLTVQELAERLKLSPQTIRRLLSDDPDVKPALICSDCHN